MFEQKFLGLLDPRYDVDGVILYLMIFVVPVKILSVVSLHRSVINGFRKTGMD